MTDPNQLNIKLITILTILIQHVRNERRLYTEEEAAYFSDGYDADRDWLREHGAGSFKVARIWHDEVAGAGTVHTCASDQEAREEGKREVIKMSDLTPEERAGAARQIKKLLLGAEPGDDEEIFYYLSPFPEDREVTDEPQPRGEEGNEEIF